MVLKYGFATIALMLSSGVAFGQFLPPGQGDFIDFPDPAAWQQNQLIMGLFNNSFLDGDEEMQELIVTAPHPDDDPLTIFLFFLNNPYLAFGPENHDWASFEIEDYSPPEYTAENEAFCAENSLEERQLMCTQAYSAWYHTCMGTGGIFGAAAGHGIQQRQPLRKGSLANMIKSHPIGNAIGLFMGGGMGSYVGAAVCDHAKNQGVFDCNKLAVHACPDE